MTYHSNQIEIIGYMGSDKTHALAAWASTFAEFGLDLPTSVEWRVDHLVNHILNNGKRKRSIKDLLEYLAENEHTSPFRFSSFIFSAKIDIATHIQKLKHRVILEAENAESARYKELTDDNYYLPNDWLDYGYLGKHWYEQLKIYTEVNNAAYHNCLNDLIKSGMSKKRAKESARYFKMMNSQINTMQKISFDGLIQFYHKRGDKNVAQNEIAHMAKEMLRLVKELPGNPFEYSLKAFGYDF